MGKKTLQHFPSCVYPITPDPSSIDQWPDISGGESVWDAIAPPKHAPSKDAAVSSHAHQQREREEEKRHVREREKLKEGAERKKKEEEIK